MIYFAYLCSRKHKKEYYEKDVIPDGSCLGYSGSHTAHKL